MSDPQYKMKVHYKDQLRKLGRGASRDLAERLGFARQDAVTRMLNTDPEKESREIKAHEKDTIEAFFAEKLEPAGRKPKPQNPVSESHKGTYPKEKQVHEVVYVDIIGEVAMGVWVEETAYIEPHDPVPMMNDPQFRGMKLFALRARGPSMNRIIHDGDVVICVDKWELGKDIADEDIVVVVRTRSGGQMRETTLKQVEIKDGKIRLWPRSDDPRFQSPIELNESGERGVTVEITAFVVDINHRVLKWNRPPKDRGR